MEKLADILKMFLERYFVTTIVSIAATILICARFPDILQIKTNTNSVAYGIMVYCIVFIVVLAMRNFVYFVKRKIDERRYKRLQEEHQKDEIAKMLKELWGYVDGLNPCDKRALYTFIHTNNAPQESYGYYFGNSIFNNPNIVNVSTGAVDQQYIRPKKSKFSEEHICMPIPNSHIQISVKKYRLKDEFFEMLKYSYEKYGRISNFEEDNQYDKT